MTEGCQWFSGRTMPLTHFSPSCFYPPPNPFRLHQRSRSVVATDGVYNNSYFMHAATSHVGNTVQLLTRSGVTFEGIFRTFSPQFEVVLEMAHRVEAPEKEEANFNASTVVDTLIFKPTDIVSILAKDVDLDYATRDYFQTDSAISSRCNGSSRGEDKELEPWDPTSGTVNGEMEFLLELDGNANGWDANDMFHKNETMYGVQSTFDQSLAGYTMQIQKKDTQDFKDAEAKAEEIAKEIESHPAHNERVDVENGDEEAAFAAVERERPSTSSPDANMQSKGPSTNTQKYVPPAKRKGQSTGKLVRSTPPPSNNNGPQIPQSPQAPHKNNNYQAIPMVQPPPQQQPPPQSQQQPQISATPQQYIHTQPPYMHSQPPPIVVGSKMNGDGANVPSGNQQKAQMPPRNIRQQYAPAAAPQVAYTEPPPSMVGPQAMPNPMPNMGKPPMHVAHPHAHVVTTHMAPPPGPGEAMSPPGIVHQIIQVPPKLVSAPPQPQRTPRSREEQVQEFRNFKENFHLAPSSAHQHPQPDHSPPQMQVPQQPPPPQPQQVGVMESPAAAKSQHQPPSPPQEMQQMPPQQQIPPPQIINTQAMQPAVVATQPPQQPPPPQQVPPAQQQQPPLAVTPSSGAPSASTTPPQQVQQSGGVTGGAATGEAGSGVAEKPAGTKKFVLNPAAKPFTPRSPSTPNPSRPHTPQTPGPAIVQGAATAAAGGYPQPAQHVATAPTSLMTIPTYVVPTQQGPFQTSQHHHAGQQSRYRKKVGYSSSAPRWDRRNLSYPVQASQIQVQAATGTPILAAAPIQQFMPYPQTPHHPQQFHSQPYQHVMRMYPEAPHQPPLQYLAPTPPSTTPSPGQPHQQYHPQPSPAGGGPPAFTPAGPQTPQFQMVCPVLTAAPPQLMPPYFQGTGQPPHGNIHVLMGQQHPAQ
ncbi:ataxin-2 homolog isoform X1 [Phlebotomus papatasi]|uniref:ataxin-2 homolog isoform X1 n=1 Tax=Phlebotomus papatasi TaxID=29031 RepID=UPI002483D69A|nr:ataxin-2 homolog isoform X1 [Phlebotomus papatasi]